MVNNVLVVIVTYNRLNDLVVSVDSLKRQSVQCFDVLVVNNGSSDGTKEWLDCAYVSYFLYSLA